MADILRIKAVSVGVVVIKGEATGRYLAMDGKGHLYGSVSLYCVLKYSRWLTETVWVLSTTAQHRKITAVKAAVSSHL